MRDEHTGLSAPEPVKALPQLYRRALRSIVGVRIGENVASGVVLDPRGLVATCRHVVGTETQVFVRLPCSRELPARVIRSSLRTDLAFLLLPNGEYDTSNVASMADLEVGQEIVAIGHPHGLANTLNRGVISGLGRLFHGTRFIQTDAPSHNGNSGGPVLCTRGRVVGICSFGYGALLNFAVPADEVQAGLEELQASFPKLTDARYCPVCGGLSLRPIGYCEACGSIVTAPNQEPEADAQPRGPAPGPLADQCPACDTATTDDEIYCRRCGSALTDPNPRGGNE